MAQTYITSSLVWLSFKIKYAGWWFEPLCKILVSWDDYSQSMEKKKMFQTTNQILMKLMWEKQS